MAETNSRQLVSNHTQEIFSILIAAGANPAGLLALTSSAYADGGNHVLNQLEDRLHNAPD